MVSSTPKRLETHNTTVPAPMGRQIPNSSAASSSRLPQHSSQSTTKEGGSVLEAAVNSIFGPCVGAVDIASYLIPISCRGTDTEEKKPKEVVPVLGAKLKKPATTSNMKLRRRQGDTLEFPANAGFDDDVSAISAHTLEEMERLEMFKRSLNQAKALRNVSKKDELGWSYQVKRPASMSSNNSLGVSTSGSASSGEDEKQSKPKRGATLKTRKSTLIDI